MKTFLIILFGIVNLQPSAEAKDTKKTVDPNFRKAAEALKKSLDDYAANKDPMKEIEKGLRFFSDTMCFQSFEQEADEEVIKEIFPNSKDPQIATQEKLQALTQDKEFHLKLLELRAKFVQNPKSVCSFSFDENTPAMIARKKQEEEAKRGFNQIMALKKSIHPVFIKLISDIEKNKSKVASRRFNPIELDDDNYEKNFVKVYDFETKYVENKAIAKMAIFNSECIESVRNVFQSHCNGKPRYGLVKGAATRFLLCADDNQSKLSKKCEYKQTFLTGL